MDRTPVSSSQIKSVGFDAGSSTLEVEFINKSGGSVYQYAGVPAEVHAKMMAAESVGKFFGASIKGQYEFKKMEADRAAA